MFRPEPGTVKPTLRRKPMDTSAGTLDAYERANELYWGSDRSVNQIAEELDLSKGALYEMIRPRPTGLGCPVCSAEVLHSNRTAKERARVDCADCGWDGSEGETVSRGVGSGTRPSRGPTAVIEGDDDIYPANDYDRPGPPPARVGAVDLDGRRLIAGGALLGAAVGLALVIWARRR
jgi:predicted RNA-binding Zn-ribbon protein involved in translation (DUF1610 family)